MKHLKKLGVLAMAAVLCISLASCGQFVPSATLEVDPATGAGTANFTMVVPKNGADGVGNNFIEPNGDSEANEAGYIKSPDALLTLLKSKVPSGFTVTMKEQTKMVDVEDKETGEIDTVDKGSFDYTVTFSFTSIKDYNEKVKKWLPAQYWDLANVAYENNKIQEAAMTTTGDAKNATVKLTVDMRILEVMCQWAFDVAKTDTTGAVVDGGSGFDYTQAGWNWDKGAFDVKFNGKNTHKTYSANKPEIAVEATGIDTTAKEEPTNPTKPTNPSTGEPLAVSAVLLTAAAAGALLIARKRNK